MALTNQLAHASANTAFLAKGAELFSGKQDGSWRLLVEEVPLDGQSIQINAVGPNPAVIELVGSRQFQNLRALSVQAPVKTYTTRALSIPRREVELDKAGAVTQRLSQYLDAAANFWEKPAFDAFLGNPKGIDGVSLINDSHPQSATGSTWDNKTTDNLSPSAFQAGLLAMAGLRLENGEHAGMYPSHLFVSPKFAQMALELTGSMRPFPTNTSGVEAYTSALAASQIENFLVRRGMVEVVIVDRMYDGSHDDDWILADLSKPGIRPMICGLGSPMAVAADDPSSSARIHHDANVYYVQGDGVFAGFAPHCIYGKLT